jgi:hypothetical protein
MQERAGKKTALAREVPHAMTDRSIRSIDIQPDTIGENEILGPS